MKRILLTLIGIIAFSIGMNAETYTHQFGNNQLTSAGGTVTLNDFEWTASSATPFKWTTGGKGYQIGESKNPCKSYSLSTTAFAEFTIKKVTVYSCMGSGGDAVLTITVGNEYSEAFNLTTTNTPYTINCKTKGNINISWAAGNKAYFVSKIEIEYEIPADMVDVEEPEFTTPVEKIYADEITVYAQTEAQDLTLYYTIDGTDPSYEDYNSDPRVGTTKRGGGWQLGEALTDSITVNTIRAMAVKVDGETVYKSDIVEATYIVSPSKLYLPATSVTNSGRYAFVASNDSVADALVPAIEKGFLTGRKTKRVNKAIESVEYDAFTFTETGGGYTIQDAAGRYMYIAENSNEFHFAKEMPEIGAVWSVSINEGKAEIKNGNSTVYYVTDEDKFGCYATVEGNMELPSLYKLREYPQATITPEMNSEVKGLQEITITCDEGIDASDDLTLRVKSGEDENHKYEINVVYKCEQVDENTLKFTTDQSLESYNNIDIYVEIEKGSILLNPDEIGYPIPVKGKYIHYICKYKHLGNAEPAEILNVTPSDNSKVETLKYILFTFSNNTGKTQDAEKSVKLYIEGSDVTFPIEFSNCKEDSTDPIENELQRALVVTTPITENGTYILEVEDGFFEDRNGNPVKGMKLKYIIGDGISGIDDIIVEGETSWTVYNVAGVKVLETVNAEELNKLSGGIYIINGNKILVK